MWAFPCQTTAVSPAPNTLNKRTAYTLLSKMWIIITNKRSKKSSQKASKVLLNLTNLRAWNAGMKSKILKPKYPPDANAARVECALGEGEGKKVQ